MILRACAGAVVALVTATTSLAGQQLKLRIGGVHARYADAVSGSAGSFTTRLAWDLPGVQGLLDGTFSQFTSGPWAAQAAGGVLGLRYVGPHQAQGFSASGDGGLLNGGVWSGLGSAGPVVALARGDWIFSAGASAGGVRRIDRAAYVSVAGAADLRRDMGSWLLEGSVTATRAGPFHFTDASLGAGYRVGAVSLRALAGARTGSLGGRPWYEGRGAWTLGSRVQLEIEGGTYPRDLSGFTGGAYFSFGVWLGIGGRAQVGSATEIARRLAASQAAVRLDSLEPGRQRVVFRVAGARSVAIAGDWNEWRPDSLERVDASHWRADLTLAPGAHRFSLIVNGHTWMVPRGVATLPDGKGGKVGLLIVGS